MMRIEARGIGKKAGGHVLLRGVTLDIPAGGVSVIIGPNGAGKTTLLKIMGLLDKPTSGRMAYDGRAADGLNARERTAIRRRMGFIFQHPLLLNGTVLGNMRHALALRRRSFEAAPVEAALGAVGLAGKKGLDVRVLSGG